MFSAEDCEAIRAGLGKVTGRGVIVLLDDDGGPTVAVHAKVHARGLVWHGICDVPRDLLGPFTRAELARAVVRDLGAYWAETRHLARAPLRIPAESA